MDETALSEIADVPLESPADFNVLIASLRAAGADRFDPVRLHYLDVLAARALAQQGTVRRLLDARLAQALAELSQRLAKAQAGADAATTTTAAHPPQHSLGALVRQLEQASNDTTQARPHDNTGVRPELKTLRQFRTTWSTLSANKQLTQALEQAPKNAGPINSHMLVLRSLALMRDVSPEYLNRFLSYADTLLGLDQGEKDKPAAAKKPSVMKVQKK